MHADLATPSYSSFAFMGMHLFLGERNTFLARRTALLFISVSDKRVRKSFSELRKLGHVAYIYERYVQYT
jgi:hypothetical protein